MSDPEVRDGIRRSPNRSSQTFYPLCLAPATLSIYDHRIIHKDETLLNVKDEVLIVVNNEACVEGGKVCRVVCFRCAKGSQTLKGGAE